MKYGFSYNRYTKNQMLYGDSARPIQIPPRCQTTASWTCSWTWPATTPETQSAPIRHYVNQTPSAYVLDNWHVTPNSASSLAFVMTPCRMPGSATTTSEISIPEPLRSLPSFRYGPTAAALRPTSPDLYHLSRGIPPPTSTVPALQVSRGFPRAQVTNDYRTLQPRLGFSQDIFGNGKTVLRGGFGAFYERLMGNDIYNAATNAPFDPLAQPGRTSTSASREPNGKWTTSVAFGALDFRRPH